MDEAQCGYYIWFHIFDDCAVVLFLVSDIATILVELGAQYDGDTCDVVKVGDISFFQRGRTIFQVCEYR